MEGVCQEWQYGATIEVMIAKGKAEVFIMLRAEILNK